MMRGAFYLLMICQICCFATPVLAEEDYTECKARCAEESADCLTEPEASEPETRLSKEVECLDKADDCDAECEKLKGLNEVQPPPYSVTSTRD